MSTSFLLFSPRRLALNFARAHRRAEQEGPHPLWQAIDHELLERISEINRPFLHILVLGKTPSALAATLAAQNPERAITKAYYLHTPEASALCLKDEVLPFAPQSFDLIILNQILQHINDVPGFLIQLRQSLKPDGLLLAACLGGETLRELRQSFAQTESQLKGGISPRIAPMLDVRAGGQLLQRAGFALPAVDHSLHTLMYQDSFALMRDLRHLGETQNLTAHNPINPGRAFFREVDTFYKNSFVDETGAIRATFDVMFLAGWAPATNQQIPLKPGSAEHSLENALNNALKSSPKN